MRNAIIRGLGCVLVAIIFSGCSANLSVRSSEEMLRHNSTEEITDQPIKGTENASTEDKAPETEATKPYFSQGDIPRIYITTANIQNKSNSQNLALDKKVMTDCCEADSFRASYLTDGNMDTRWSSTYENNASFQIDLGKSETFGYIRIDWENAYGIEYCVSVSEDNTNWTMIIDEKNGAPGSKDYSFQEVTARYIQWQGIKRGTEYGYSMFEFAVYKNSNATQEKAVVDVLETPYLKVFTEEYQPVSLTILDSTGGEYETISDTEATICIRGNSTANTDKKPYNIKLSSKKDVLGMGEGKKWCLLANHFDKTMLRNKLAYDFADCLGLPTTLEASFIELYIDGVYEGVYLLSEPVSDGKNRVDIDISQDEFLFERCAYVEELSQGMFVSPVYQLNFEFKSPDADEVTEEQRAALINFLNTAEKAMKSGKQSEMEQVIDLESFAAMYVFEELFKNIDYSFDSNYFYVKGGKLYAGPVWDMDLSMGNISTVYEHEPYYIYNNAIIDGVTYGNGSGDSTQGFWAMDGWYQVLMKQDFFQQLIADKFTAVESEFERLYAENGVIDQLTTQYLAAFERNYSDTYWEMTKVYSKYEREIPDSTYLANVEYLKTWLEKRKEWIYNHRD